ncbi:hypothetical protein J3R82DRAFT_8274 [Butyriboletus roseoflavus]|nr:hypothetical protein J3R82DRAFT_8274 [Butyriboletus roseoflavus]
MPPALAFHDFWGCLLTPDNVAAGIFTDDLRYHVWVATKRVVESGLIKLTDKEALIRAVMDQFMVELGLVLLDLCSGPLVLFVDPRLHDDSDMMVSRATAMVAKFDAAQVRRWRIIVTLPATEDGICAAQVLTNRHGIQTNLSLVSCLAHAAACIEASAGTVSMSVEPIMEWYEQKHGIQAGHQDHPGIETIQSCATFIHRHGINTTLLTTDVRMVKLLRDLVRAFVTFDMSGQWAELKQLGGIGAAALKKDQLDQIPMRRLTTWCPRPDDKSPATLRALQAEHPSHHLDSNKGFLASLPAENRSLISAVLYVRLGKMAVHMETIEKAVWDEIKRRIRLETIPLESLYRRPAASCKRHKSRSRRNSRQEKPFREGIDYF